MKDIFAGNQVIHEMSDRYGWKEGSAEKTVLHGALGALTGSMNGGNALSGAVSGWDTNYKRTGKTDTG